MSEYSSINTDRIELLIRALEDWLCLADKETWDWVDWGEKEGDPRRIIAAYDGEHPLAARYRKDELYRHRIRETFTPDDCAVALRAEGELQQHGPSVAAWLVRRPQSIPQAEALIGFLVNRAPRLAEQSIRALMASLIYLRTHATAKENGTDGAEKWMSASDLAKLIKREPSPVESFLRRYRQDYPDSFREMEGARRNEPRFMYRTDVVLPVLLNHFRPSK